MRRPERIPSGVTLRALIIGDNRYCSSGRELLLLCPNCERLCRESVYISQTCLLGTPDDMSDIVRAVEKIKQNVDELSP